MIVENYWKMLADIQTVGGINGTYRYTDIDAREGSPQDGSQDKTFNNLISGIGAIYGSPSDTPMSYYDTTVANRIGNNLVATTGISINIARDVTGMTRVFTITGRNYGSDITISRVGLTKYFGNYGVYDVLIAEVDLAEPIVVPGGNHTFNILLAWDDTDVAQVQSN